MITAEQAPKGEPLEMVLSPKIPDTTAFDAFMNGAPILCAIVTGVPELPFFTVGNVLMFGTYDPVSGASTDPSSDVENRRP
ncbi:MAG: hypothetical protein HWE26_19610 [Alteromonadaceae bacterium]|nr:hypothetical protein [Alteromonadaceae bacterium]